ncbi:hypothetical protein CLOM_g2201, partial [Closterium sp. NIES-68]
LRLWVPVSSAPLSSPVLLFQHGFAAKTHFYSQLLSRIASHGFIVVAPQMYPFIGRSNTRPEMRGSVRVITWMRKNLATWLQQKKQRRPVSQSKQQLQPISFSPPSSSSSPPPFNVPSPSTSSPKNASPTATYPFRNTSPDWSKFVISGHSVGGKVAFGVARNIVSPSSPVPISALLLFDPSDGTSNTSKNVPPVLVHRPNSLVLSVPALIVGSGLGPIPKAPGLPACPPKYFGHKTFFSDLVGPAYYFVVPEYGHLDFYDKRIGIWGALGEVACRRGPAKRPMHVAASGIGVAFLKATVQGDSANLDDILSNPIHSPVWLAAPQSKGV